MIRLLLVCIAACALGGCGLNARQAQHVADGIAGIDAATPRVAEDPVATAALAGARDHVEAVAEGKPLPPPILTAPQIAAQPQQYRAQAQTGLETARAIVPWWGWALGLLGGTLGIARCLPGPGGAIADLAWQILAPGAAKVAEQRTAVHAEGFLQLVRVVEGLGNTQTIGDFKAKVTTKTSAAVRDAVLDAIRGTGPDPAPPIQRLAARCLSAHC